MAVVGAVVGGLFLRGRRGRRWPVPPHIPHERLTLRGNAGARLAAFHIRHPEPRGIVVLAHPDRRYGKHWFLREGWADWLLANGYEGLAFDFAAYGESNGGSTYFHDDVAAACEAARRLRPDLPVHLVGLSIGAFASVNAAVRLPWLASLALESPYPTFSDWYAHAPGRRGSARRDRGHATLGRLNDAMARVWPRTARRIDAAANAAAVHVPRILVAASPTDAVTPIALSRAVHAALPAHARWVEDEAPHLGLFASPAYRDALLELWGTPRRRPAAGARHQEARPAGAAARSPPKRLYESGREAEPSPSLR